jgi:hypothetical protein
LVLGASGDFNVTRATTATRVNASGLIEVVASGIPRLDYFASGGVVGCPALLVEPQAQNLALRSEEFNVSGSWALINAGTGSLPSVTANAVVSPDGTQNAETVLLNRGAGNAIGDQSTLQQTITLATSGTYTFSVYAKATASGDVGKQIFLREGSAGDLIPYTLTANWVRLTRTQTGLASGSNIFQIGNRGTVTADNSVSVDLWGAQLETGSVATSYIPTTTGQITRNADVISVSGAVSGAIGQTEGTIYAEFINTFSSSYNDGLLIRVFADANNEVFGRKEAASNRYTFRWRANSQNTTFTNVNVPDGVNKVALAYKSGDTALFLNGVQVGSTSTDVRAFSVNPTTVALGSNGGAGQFFNDRIRAAALYTTRLTNDQLMLLTMPGNNTYLPQAVWDNYLSRPGNDEVPDCLYTRHADLLDV